MIHVPKRYLLLNEISEWVLSDWHANTSACVDLYVIIRIHTVDKLCFENVFIKIECTSYFLRIFIKVLFFLAVLKCVFIGSFFPQFFHYFFTFYLDFISIDSDTFNRNEETLNAGVYGNKTYIALWIHFSYFIQFFFFRFHSFDSVRRQKS